MMRLSLAAVVVLVAGCPAGSSYVTEGTGARRGTTGAVAQGASSNTSSGGSIGTTASSGTSTGTATGTSSTGTTSGSSGVYDPFAGATLDSNGCPLEGERLDVNPDAGACEDGQLELLWNLVDFCAGAESNQSVPPPANANLRVSSLYDETPIVSHPCAYYHACLDPQTPFAFQVTGDNYLETISPNFALTQSEQYEDAPGMFLFCTELSSNVSVGLNPTLGTVAATVFHLDPEPDGGCGDLSGWHFWVTDVDGGLIDAGVGYTSGLAIANGTVTTGTGIALIYNLEPALQNVRLLATKVADALPDGGTLCPNVPDTPSFQMIGTFPVRGEAFTVAPYVVP